MQTKGFFDVFTRYAPIPEKRQLLESAKDAKFRYTKAPMRVEVELSFDKHCDAETLYEIEDECRALYNAESFKIIPHFPPEEYDPSKFDEITYEAANCGAVTHGFFTYANYVDDGDTMRIELPFFDTGIEFVKNANTEAILSNILFSRYGIRKNIIIAKGTGAEELERKMTERREEILVKAEEENRERQRRERALALERQEAEARANDPHYGFESRVGLSSLAGVNEVINDHLYQMGATVYNISKAELLYGVDFDLVKPTPLSDLEKTKQNAIFLGTVFEKTSKEMRGGEKFTYTIGISDGACGTYLKFIAENDSKMDWFKDLKTGVNLAVYGSMRRDKFDNEAQISPRGIKKISREYRLDKAEEKRVELHLHTNMSQMDAIIGPGELVDTAIRWGHKAIAVTDHGNVQAFPEVMLALEKAQKAGKDNGLKILYGMEAYYVNDTARCVFGSKYPAFDDEMTVFDIETTGLSNRNCKIIEIGAVKIKNGEIIDTIDFFVDPGEPIPPEITELTSITDDMVKGQIGEREAIERFLAFAGDTLLIAHNANFDVGFIRIAAERHGIPFENTYLDTVGLSRYVNPELKKHKLDVIAEHYNLHEFHHHRASDDAEMLAEIFFVMMERLRSEGIHTFERMVDAMSENSDPLKLPTNHMVIFAKNKEGLKNLYKLISYSYLNYYKRFPRIPKTVLEEHREGLIIGSACEAGELYKAIIDNKSSQEIEDIASFYDYLEIQPIANNRFLIADEKVKDDEQLKDINKRIYALGKKLGKPVCATCDAHFLNEEDEIYRRILLAGMKFADADKPTPIYLRTTDEMLEEFSYLGKEEAREVVITNPNMIADMCERIRPIPEGRYEPDLPGAKEDLENSCWKRAHEWYGDELPEIVEKRLEKELTSIIKNGFAVLYMIAVKLVAYSEELGYQVGSRGSVGSSFVATMSGISEVNPLPPHYRCLKCRYSEFFTDGSVGSGFDLPDKVCPVCGEMLYQDGHDIPFETFLGFYGDKSPDIDLNFSGDVQGRVHKYTEELFGEGHVFRAGTIGTLADKTAWGYVSKYLEERQIKIPKAELSHMVTRLVGIKRTTGQHPGGIIVVPSEYDIYDFTPVQHPADDPNSDIITTHFQFSYLHDTILKLDELGHDMPTKYKMLEKYTNTSVLDVKMNDTTIYELFESTRPLGITPDDIGGSTLATFGIPEFGTRFLQQVLVEAKPKNFADLLQISGLTHGTDVWLGNAQELIKNGTCTISEVVGTRDSIMLYLIAHGLESKLSFDIMESVRKGKGLKPDWEAEMIAHGVPDWYIWSCKKIKYMFPKAHAAAYVMSAIRLGWYKIYYPMEFYAAFLTVAPGGFDAEIAIGGYKGVNTAIGALETKIKENQATAKDNEQLSTLFLVREAMARGVRFLGVDLENSHATAFLPENGMIRMPFNSLPGLGDTAAHKIVEVRDRQKIHSVEELRLKTGISKAVIEILRRNHVLDNLTETNQMTLF